MSAVPEHRTGLTCVKTLRVYWHLGVLLSNYCCADNDESPSFLSALESCLGTSDDPILPYKTGMQLLGAADNVQLRPFVLKLLLQRLPKQDFGTIVIHGSAEKSLPTTSKAKLQPQLSQILDQEWLN